MDVEEGEIVESDEEDLPKSVSENLEVYTCLERPVAPRPPAQPPAVSDGDDSPAGAVSSDSDTDSDSDSGGGGGGRKRARPAAAPAAAMDTGHNAAFAEASRRLQERRARLSVWTTVLAEDGITAGLADGLGQLANGPRVERDVESYQLPAARPAPDGDGADGRRKRGFREAQRGWRRVRDEAVRLEPLAVTVDSAAEQVAADVALKLREEKPEIIANVVRVIGVKKSIELFEETKSVEEGGGMLVNNWSRRRTPGGVFIQLLKTDPEVSEDQVRDIFREERRQHDRERKELRRRQRRARLARLAAAGAEREPGERSDDSDDSAADSNADSNADSEAAQSAGSRSELPAGDSNGDISSRDAMSKESKQARASQDDVSEDMDRDELEVSNEIVFE